jgi:hypothetical protein
MGQTIENVYLDLGKGRVFAPSLVYVGLSRVPSLNGLGMRRKITMSDVYISKESLLFLESL